MANVLPQPVARPRSVSRARRGEARVAFAADALNPSGAAFKVVDPKRGRNDWKVYPRYEVRAKLGSGSYGCVCEALDRDKNRAVAIKRTTNVFDNIVTCRRTVREVCILAMLQNHDNIVRLLHVVSPSSDSSFNEVYMVMEVCDSDLRQLLRRDLALVPTQVCKILYAILAGLKYLHSGGIWHRDLKPANCLLNRDWTVKICDFGLARAAGGRRPADAEGRLAEPCQTSPQRRQLSSHVCTRWYRAPEVILLQEGYTEAIDIWSVGCIFGELIGMLSTSRARDRRGPMFPGDACYPLSRDRENQKLLRDQLETIFDTIGTPPPQEVDALDHQSARRYVRGFAARRGCGLSAKVPEADGAALEVLHSTLQFNPAMRWSADALLDLRLFAGVRQRASEKLTPGILKLRFDEEPDDVDRLQRFLLKEIRRFNPANCPQPHSARRALSAAPPRTTTKCPEPRTGRQLAAAAALGGA